MLGTALLFFLSWWGHFGLSSTPLPASTPQPVYLEVTGTADRPGVYEFPEPPTLSHLLTQAGATAPHGQPDQKLSSGSKVEVTADGQYRLSRMDGPRLRALGLALDLNNATAADLEALPGIGPVMARRILDFRQKHGPFKKIDDLEKVSGIGPKKLAQIKPYVFIEVEENN